MVDNQQHASIIASAYVAAKEEVTYGYAKYDDDALLILIARGEDAERLLPLVSGVHRLAVGTP